MRLFSTQMRNGFLFSSHSLGGELRQIFLVLVMGFTTFPRPQYSIDGSVVQSMMHSVDVGHDLL